MTNSRQVVDSSLVRVLVGLAVSVLFLVITFARVDLARVAQIVGRATPGWLLVASGLGLGEVAVRAWRWQMLLRPLARVPYHVSAAYLSIGYFANALLPARLGDVARSYLAGGAFATPRLSVLGTVVIERLADGIAVVAIGLGLGLLVPQGNAIAATAISLGLVVLTVGGLIASALLVLKGARLRLDGRLGSIKTFLGQLALGGRSLNSAVGWFRLVGSTLLPFAVATGTLAAVGGAMGIPLSPAQAGLAMAAIALSTAIPAAPSSVGTYEFVGVTMLTAFGVPPAPALAAVVTLHVIGTLPVALIGLLMTWHYHIRVGALVRQKGSTVF